MKLSSVSFNEFMAQLPVLTEPEDKDWLALRFSLNQLPEKVSDALLAAAIPHWFDRDYLNALLDMPLSEDEFNALVKLSSIEPFPARGENTFNVHERTRKLLLKRLWENDQAYYKKLSRKASAYCQRQHHRDNTLWLVEGFYHELLVNPNVMTGITENVEILGICSDPNNVELLVNNFYEYIELKGIFILTDDCNFHINTSNILTTDMTLSKIFGQTELDKFKKRYQKKNIERTLPEAGKFMRQGQSYVLENVIKNILKKHYPKQ